MTFFSTPTPEQQARIDAQSAELAARRERTRLRGDDADRRTRMGSRLLTAGAAALVMLGFCPAPYVLRQPGPVFDGLGEIALEPGAEPEEIIQISGAEVHEPESGSLDVLTVNVQGTPEYEPSWFEALLAWATPERDVLPIEAYFADGETGEERDAATTQQMTDSQDVARAAALRQLGYEVPSRLEVAAVAEDAPAAGALQEGDVIVAVGGEPVADVLALRAAAEAAGLSPIALTIERDGVRQDVTVTPELRTIDGEDRPAFGIGGAAAYDFPVDIEISLGEVGGPSAGMMLALGIMDKLTPGDMTGGRAIAGTGTIDDAGAVGPIGGIRQKLYASIDAGAEAFLAPTGNCAEATDRGAPDDIPIYAIGTLDEAEAAVAAIAAGDASGLVTCEAVVAAGGGTTAG